ncbi:MAG TPA: RagB/SusD family nutrient uptake outer membrane protein [Cyclobacteriaceae bacterium]|nr:RagB/SusD family nutrient uptake outer membrane protein [Cyclobacteriaceae bacterium]
MKRINILFTALTTWVMLAGCSDDFLNRPPQDRLVDANFYKTDEQVLAGTAPLYSAAWKTYVDKANFKLGDIRGGTVFRAWGDRDAVEFNITDVSEPNEQAYQAFYVIIGQANLAISNINTYAGADVSEEIKNHAIAEARFMRATAYTHLVTNYGEVPIIENNLDHLFSPSLKRNTIESVWEFIKRDYEFAAANLSEASIQPGRITKWSAEGMLARTHLTLAGLNASPGARDQAHLDKAKEYAERVITMSGKRLKDDYASLFLYPYDNNEESLFELEWVFTTSPNGYEASNTMVSQITYSNDIAANGDGWGGDLSATWWLLSLYDGLMVDDGATPGFTLDQRLKASFMLPGFTYPELINNATHLPHVFPDPGTSDNNYASIKKYVVGKLPGESDRQRYPNNTYMLRLAEMYLIYAEAALGNQGSTKDPKALEYFNAVHTRAGLPAIIADDPNGGPIALDWQMIFEERMKEFAMESMAWYDLVRLSYYDEQKAYDIINAQDRGLFVAKPNQWPDPTAWTFTKTSWFANRYAVANSGNFRLPLPASEVSQAPSLSEEPVPYEFE